MFLLWVMFHLILSFYFIYIKILINCLKESGVKMSIYFAIFLPKGLYLNVGSVVKDYYTIVQALRYSVL